MRISIGASNKTIIGKKKDADRSGIGTKITGTARSLSIAGSRTLNYLPLEIALSVMVTIGMTKPIDAIRKMIGDLMGRLEGERRFMIGWGVGSVYTTGLAIVLHIFPGTKKSLKKWQMHEFPMSSYICRDANTHRMESREHRRPSARQSPLPPWCPEGLTKTQKRRLQREIREELRVKILVSLGINNNQILREKGHRQMLTW